MEACSVVARGTGERRRWLRESADDDGEHSPQLTDKDLQRRAVMQGAV